MSDHVDYRVADGPDLELYPGRRTIRLRVANTGDRAVQVGSHYHFFEANPALLFDRDAAWGMHLAVPAGLAVRFEPGAERTVELVDFGGDRVLHGFAGLTEGAIDDPSVRGRAREAAVAYGFAGFPETRPAPPADTADNADATAYATDDGGDA